MSMISKRLREAMAGVGTVATEDWRLHSAAADEIERLERELAAVTGREDALVAEIDALRGDVADAEAHNAAMRGALVKIDGLFVHVRSADYPDSYELGVEISCPVVLIGRGTLEVGDIRRLHAALTPDAGAKLLKVVEAAEEFAKFPSIENGHKIVQALAAWRVK